MLTPQVEDAMARIPLVSPSDMPPGLRDLIGAGHRPPRELGNVRVYAHRPELAAAYVQFMQALRTHRVLPPRLVELVRLRVAFHNQCRSCMAVRHATESEGMSEELVCQLHSPGDGPDLTEREQVALRFADLMATEHLSVTDATIAELRAHFSDEEVVELGLNIGTFIGYGRMSMAWDMVDDLPERFRDRSGAMVTPWVETTTGSDL